MSVVFVCEFCGLQETQLLRHKLCGGCKVIRYCSRNCQTSDWQRHKNACNFARSESLASSATRKDARVRQRMIKWTEEPARIQSLVHTLLSAIGANLVSNSEQLVRQNVLAVEIVRSGGTFHIQSTQALNLAAACERGGEWVDRINEIEFLNATGAPPAVYVVFETVFGLLGRAKYDLHGWSL
ncbi:hypothetical protein C8J57DRAFT_1240926 [Mycena rebaudengoi]|nr:hypothetical protein C8J57DRAFT_1240926 [Mycena rebaudengoi]